MNVLPWILGVGTCLVVLIVAVASVLIVRRIGMLEKEIAGLRTSPNPDPSAQVSSGLSSLQVLQHHLLEKVGRALHGVDSLMPAVHQLQKEVHGLRERSELRAESQREEREMLRRLELIIAGGAHRGEAGENILAEILSALPPGLLEHDLRLDNLVVEFAVRLPGDRFLPIDSKWPETGTLERLQKESDAKIRRELAKKLQKTLAAKANEVAKYLHPERTWMLGVAAVPDAVYHAAQSVHAEAYKKGVIIVPYSLAVPYVLSVLVFVWRFGHALDLSRNQASFAAITSHLDTVLEILEGPLSKAVTMADNAATRIRREIMDARRAVVEVRGESPDPLDPAANPRLSASSDRPSPVVGALPSLRRGR